MFQIIEFLIDGCEHPLATSLRPVFSWKYEKTSVNQDSYQLLVKDEKDGHLMWDSGWLHSDRTFGLIYRGATLNTKTTYVVTLRVKSINGDLSEATASFETCLGEKDWKGSFVGVPQAWCGGALALRKRIPAFTSPVKKARAYVAAIGYHELYINGEKIGNEVLCPPQSNYQKVVYYETYDVTSALKGDGDVVGLLIGNGWFGDRKALIQLDIALESGENLEIHSECNGGWWFSSSPIVYNSVYNGETYDARVEDIYPGGFTNPKLEGEYNYQWFGSVNSQWQPETLRPAMKPGIGETDTHEGKCIATLSDGHQIYDIGVNIAGYAEIVVNGPRGSSITLKFAETLKEDGHADQANLRSALSKDTYILRGEGQEHYKPRFTYHGFRYVEVISEGGAELISLTGIHVHNILERVGSFTCSDEYLNNLHEMVVRTEQNNEHGLLTDCPQRDERFGWLNDLSTRVFQTVYNFDAEALLNKVEDDIAYAQGEDGTITDTAPYYTGGRPACPVSISYLTMALLSYHFYGDREVLRTHYQGHKDWVHYLLSRSDNFIMNYAYYGDWVACTNFPDAASDLICIASIFLYWHLLLLKEEATILQKKKEARQYGSLAKKAKEALVAKYLHDDHFHEGTQAEDGLALYLDLVPARQREKVYAHLKNSIIAHNYHLTTGNQGYRPVMCVLAEHGDMELVLQVLRNPEYPGWGYMVANGATSIWERWEKDNLSVMNSFDHPMFGSFDQLFYRYLGGLAIDDMIAGDLDIKASYVPSLNHVDVAYQSRRGLISSKWKRLNPQEIEHEVEVPPNTKVRFFIPKGYRAFVNEKPFYRTHAILKTGTHHILLKKKEG